MFTESCTSILFQAPIANSYYRTFYAQHFQAALPPTPSDQHAIISTAVPQCYMYHPPHPPCNIQPNKLKRKMWLVKSLPFSSKVTLYFSCLYVKSKIIVLYKQCRKMNECMKEGQKKLQSFWWHFMKVQLLTTVRATVTRLQAGQLRNWGSIPNKGKTLLFSYPVQHRSPFQCVQT